MTSSVCSYIYWNQDKKCSFEDYNLILPDVSIGNVGQLALDLLINNLFVENLGSIVHPCFFPFIGADPFQVDNKKLVSSCEIYECKEKKLILLQIRSRVFPSKFQEFRDLLMNFIKQFNFKQTIVIASSTSEYFVSEQLQGIPLHYLSTSTFPNKEVFTQLKWKEFSLPDNIDTADIKPIPGSFVSHHLLENCEKENMPLVILLCVCYEGNNYPDALQIIKCLNSWLSLKPINESEEVWRMPVSWKLPYGSAPPRTIY